MKLISHAHINGNGTTYRDASAYYPEMKQFIGADYHVWKGMGDLDYYTELPDDWFGNIHA